MTNTGTTVVGNTDTTVLGENLIKSFTTFFGDQFNGLWVTWNHDSKATGEKIMDIKVQANLYSAAKDYFIFWQSL